jgi:AmmeMemoRadiSam system protein A
MLDAEDKRELLAIARRAIVQHLAGGQIPALEASRPALVAPAGAFVSLHRHGELRGCIGTLADSAPLYRTVHEMAVSAATRDPRFPPLASQEVGEVEVEISVIGDLHAVRAPSEIQIGRHGIHLTRASARGVLLPQVAVEHHWSCETFLAETCRKAGLPADAWRSPDTVVETFTAQVFSEGAGEPGRLDSPPSPR